jgi:hypothetical protein
MSLYSVTLPFLAPPTAGAMSTVAFRVLIFAASVLMRATSSCLVASCRAAVLRRQQQDDDQQTVALATIHLEI